MNSISLKGRIATWSNFSAKTVEEFLGKANGDIEIQAFSYGGDIFEGFHIYNLLKAYNKGKVTVINMGVLASAGSFIAMAADTYKAFPTSAHMIHKSWTFAIGNSDELSKTIKLLDGIDNVLASENARKNNKSIKDNMELLKQDTWYIGEEQLKASGLVDEIVTSTDIAPIETIDNTTADNRYSAEMKEFEAEYAQHHPEIKIDDIANELKECLGSCNNEITPPTQQVVNSARGNGETSNKKDKAMADEKKPTAHIAALKAENSELKAKIEALQGDNEKLQADLESRYSADAVKEMIALGAKYNADSDTLTKMIEAGSIEKAQIIALEADRERLMAEKTQGATTAPTQENVEGKMEANKEPLFTDEELTEMRG